MSTKPHAHEFSLLWTHFGPYGEQGVHVHPCVVEDCSFVRIGPGRNCRRNDKHEDRDLDIVEPSPAEITKA